MEIWRDKNGLYKDTDGSTITPEAYLSAYRAKYPEVTEYWKNNHKQQGGSIMFTMELGSPVKSRVSGFAGIITSRSECLYGCNRYYVSPRVKEDGTLPEGYWMDEAELEVIRQPEIQRANNGTGGPVSKIR